MKLDSPGAKTENLPRSKIPRPLGRVERRVIEGRGDDTMKMTQTRKCVLFLSLAVFMLLVHICASAQVSVLTQHNNNQRTGANLNETTLNTSNVNVNDLAVVYAVGVDEGVC